MTSDRSTDRAFLHLKREGRSHEQLPGSSNRKRRPRINLRPERRNLARQEVRQPSTGFEDTLGDNRVEFIICIHRSMSESPCLISQSRRLLSKDGWTFTPRQKQRPGDATNQISMGGCAIRNFLGNDSENFLQHGLEGDVSRLHSVHQRHLRLISAFRLRPGGQQLLMPFEQNRRHPKMADASLEKTVDIGPPGVHQAMTRARGTTLARKSGEAVAKSTRSGLTPSWWQIFSAKFHAAAGSSGKSTRMSKSLS